MFLTSLEKCHPFCIFFSKFSYNFLVIEKKLRAMLGMKNANHTGTGEKERNVDL